MLAHPPLLTHPPPRKILIIGAGDGGVLRETLKHKIEKVTLVEIDREVIEFSRKYLPFLGKNAFKDKRVKVVIGDGAEFVRSAKEKFDVVIIDSTDPVGPAKILFSRGFYKNVFSVLSGNGLLIRQTGSTTLQMDVLKSSYRTLKPIFPHVVPQLAAIPTYIGGFFSLTMASKKINPRKVSHRAISKRYDGLKLKTAYYNPDIHFSGMALPNYVKKALN